MRLLFVDDGLPMAKALTTQLVSSGHSSIARAAVRQPRHWCGLDLGADDDRAKPP